MIDKNEYTELCNFNSKKLKRKANFYAVLYMFCIFIPVSIGIYNLSYPTNEWIVSLSMVALFFTILPFPFFKNIERIQKYREFASDFYNLAIDFKDNYHKDTIEKYKNLNKELSKTNISLSVKNLRKKK